MKRRSFLSAAAVFLVAQVLTGRADAAPSLIAFQRWHKGQTRAVAAMTATAGPKIDPRGSHLGGSAWLPQGQRWPFDAAGRPLQFLAQIDLAVLPPIPDMPRTGLLQFFIGTDDLMGTVIEDPAKGSARVLYHPDPAAAGTVHPQPALPDGAITPFQNEPARVTGAAITMKSALMRMPISNAAAMARLPRHTPAIDHWLARAENRLPAKLWVGGYPDFVQEDFRRPGHYADYDRVLLSIDTSDHVMWGDAGIAHFLIRPEDLKAHRFDKAIFYWDCS